jgi:hypothetical protein
MTGNKCTIISFTVCVRHELRFPSDAYANFFVILKSQYLSWLHVSVNCTQKYTNEKREKCEEYYEYC